MCSYKRSLLFDPARQLHTYINTLHIPKFAHI